MARKFLHLKKIFVFVLCLVLTVSSINIGIDPKTGLYVSLGNRAYAAEPDTSAPENIKEGTILQAFCWSFSTIKDHMADIAAAGYTAVQTSPVQECLDTFPDMTLGGSGHWYYHYQPTDYTIGNYQLGTEAEFQEMCAEAEAYGIKIIVDVVPNHTAVDRTQVSEDLHNAVGGEEYLYHDTGLTNSQNYSDRLESTRYAIGNLPDINTEDPDYQDYFIAFLNQCIADGADGFRYDSAKHIGLPGDPAPDGVVNNFWDRVTTEITSADAIFNYGEVLQGGNDRIADYVDAIGATTSSNYGANIRTALVNNNFLASNISGYRVDEGIDPDNLVTWVESHDNYYNDGTWGQIDNSQVILGWAIITARADGTPLFFSRPYGSSAENEYGTNTIGIAGDDNYKNDQVAAVNRFRNAMVGEPENLSNPDGNAKVLMIERGNKGVVVVNGSYSSYVLDSQTNLADGTYINRTNDNTVFTVINGEISGVLPARSAVVLYGAEAANATTVHFYNENQWDNVYAYVTGNEALGAYPGTRATSDGDGWYRVTVPADVADGFMISFNDGADNQTAELSVNDGTKLYYVVDTAYASKSEAEAAIGIVHTAVHFFNSGSWDDISAYVYGPGESLGTWPGTGARNNGDGWWTVDIPSAPSDNLHVIFNNCGNGSQSADFVIDNPTDVYLTNENDIKYTSKVEAQTDIDMLPGTTVVYFYNNQGWEEVSAYVWGNGDTLGAWPGTPATDVGDGWWKVAVPEDPSMNLHIIFNNNNHGSQTGSIVISDITNRYTSAFNDNTYPSKEALLEDNGISNTETKVYFYNYDRWDNVYAYADNNGDLLGTYPGTLMTEGQNYWWSITIPSGVSDNLSVTFNDGGSENQSDTFTVSDRVQVYFTGANANAYQSKNAAETDINVETTKTTVYFYNNSGWSTVSAYLYGDSTAYGAWPGASCTAVENGWWKTEIPAEASANLNVIFNNGGNGAQSADFVINDTVHTYVTNFNGTKYTSIEEAEEANGVSHSEVTVYFHNVDGWSAVYAYATEEGDLLGAYPGTLATPETDGWYRITIPSGASDTLTVSFNDGNENQSDTFTVGDNAHIYFTMTETTGFASKVEAEVDDGTAPTTVTVHFFNANDWDTVNAYVYGPAEFFGGWPGAAATDEGNGWWQITIPSPALPGLHVIFNSGSSQSADFTINDFTNVFVTSLNANKYSSKAAATGVKTLAGIVTPSAISGLPNGTPKTATALGLPPTVTLTTDDGTVNEEVTWDLDACAYTPSDTAAQSFTVSGSITLPDGVSNPNHVSLETTIHVSVNAAVGNTSGGGSTPASTSGTTKTVSNDGGKVTLHFEVTPTVNGKNATAVLSSRNVIDALSEAMSGAVPAGGQRVVAFSVKTPGQVGEVALSIPGDAFSGVAKASVDALAISSSVAAITFDKKSIQTISGAGNADVTVSVAPLDVRALSLPEEIKTRVSDRPIYDFHVKNGNTTISDLNGGTAAVEIPYTLRDGENPNAIVVYYLDNSGNLIETNSIYNPETKTVKMMLSHFSKYVVGHNQVTFTDVNKTASYFESVSFVAGRRLFNGIGNNRFAPDMTMNRAMFVKILANLECADLSKYKTSSFSDVDINAWYGPAVAWAHEKGIVSGGGNGKFAPDMEITHEQMAVILNNYMIYKGITLPAVNPATSSGSAVVSSWAAKAVKAVNEAGIISGVDGYEPQAVANRAGVATMFMNFLKAWVR